ncbi:hypothetical protein F7725_007477 [Dissostichus mawsoni]|uniref:Uncharacterized protein n=1 Tax=Dissostichus mawsoni TaxID=36200 RepID=A0A7J5Y4H8_DISMA|nr:hypothetical protein F7725_007477 [Dissostichus mawsoni]
MAGADRFHSVEACLMSRGRSFHSVEACLMSRGRSFHSVEACLMSRGRSFHSVEACLMSRQIVPQCGSLSDEQGQIVPQCGSLSDVQGQIVPQCGGLSDEQGQIVPQCGSLSDEQGQIVPQCGACLMSRGRSFHSVEACLMSRGRSFHICHQLTLGGQGKVLDKFACGPQPLLQVLVFLDIERAGAHRRGHPTIRREVSYLTEVFHQLAESWQVADEGGQVAEPKLTTRGRSDDSKSRRLHSSLVPAMAPGGTSALSLRLLPPPRPSGTFTTFELGASQPSFTYGDTKD